MPGDQIIVGSVAVDVVPSAENFGRLLRAQILPEADAIGNDVGDAVSRPIVDRVSDAIPAGLGAGSAEAGEAGQSAGSKYGDAFSTIVRSKIDAALKALPAAEINADTTDAEAALLELREQIHSLSNQMIDVDVTDEEALAAIADLREQLDHLAHENPDIRVRVDAAAAEAQLDELLAKIYALDAAQMALAESMAAEIAAQKALGAEMAADIEASMASERALAAGMAKDWDAFAKESGSALPSLSGMQALLAGIVLLGPPIAAVGSVAIADLVIGIKNAHVETKGLSDSWHDLERQAGAAMAPGLQTAVDQLSKSLPQLDPLVKVLSTDLGNALAKAATWLNDGGMTKIVDYLEHEIPIVGHLFESLGSAAVNFFKLVQPLADGLMTTITAIADGVSKISSFANSGVKGVGSVTAAADKSSSQGFISKQSGGGTSGFFGGVLHDFRWLGDFGGQTGSSSDSKNSSASKAADPFNNVNPQVTDQISSADDATLANQGYQASQAAQAAKTAAAFKLLPDAYATASQAALKEAQSSAASTAAMQLENNAAGLLSAALRGLGGNNLGVAQANTAFQQGLETTTAAMKGNKNAITGTTDAALANQAALQSQVALAQQVYTATAQQTGSTIQAKAAYDQAIQSIKNHLKATGEDSTAIDNYINQISAIPPTAETKIDVDTAAAQAQVQAYVKWLAQVTTTADKNMVLGFQNIAQSGSQYQYAEGGVVDYFANGAENHIAQIAPAGAMRVWAEPETGGEAYIPLARQKRQRSLEIWAQTGERLGVDTAAATHYDTGGLTSGSGGASVTSGMGRAQELALLREIAERVSLVGSQVGDALNGVASVAALKGRTTVKNRRI